MEIVKRPIDEIIPESIRIEITIPYENEKEREIARFYLSKAIRKINRLTGKKKRYLMRFINFSILA